MGGFLTYIASTNGATASRRPELSFHTARDIFWMLTGGDVYRMLVSERGWSPHRYQDWLTDALVKSQLAPKRRSRVI